MYFTYSRHKTREDAEDAIEHYFANAEIDESDRPRIVREGTRWAVQLLDKLYSY